MKAAFNVGLRNVVPSQFHAESDAVDGQRRTGQRDIENLNSVALSLASAQEQGKGSAGEGGFKRKVCVGRGQFMQAFELMRPASNETVSGE